MLYTSTLSLPCFPRFLGSIPQYYSNEGDLARLILVSTAFEILFPEIASLNDTMLSYAEL
jgi:hypothetical protein